MSSNVIYGKATLGKKEMEITSSGRISKKSTEVGGLMMFTNQEVNKLMTIIDK